jgi:hypothetical protein
LHGEQYFSAMRENAPSGAENLNRTKEIRPERI